MRTFRLSSDGPFATFRALLRQWIRFEGQAVTPDPNDRFPPELDFRLSRVSTDTLMTTSRDRVPLVRFGPIDPSPSRDKSHDNELTNGMRFNGLPNKRGCLASRLRTPLLRFFGPS